MKLHLYILTLALLFGITALSGCEGRPDRSAFVGSVAGAAVGNQLSRGGAAATIGGAAVGAAIGADGARRSAPQQSGAAQPRDEDTQRQ